MRCRKAMRFVTCVTPSHLPTMSSHLYPLATLAQIEKTPSREDGIPAGLEDELRTYGCKLIQQAGMLLKQ